MNDHLCDERWAAKRERGEAWTIMHTPIVTKTSATTKMRRLQSALRRGRGWPVRTG